MSLKLQSIPTPSCWRRALLLLVLFLATLTGALIFPPGTDALGGSASFKAVTPFATLDSNNAVASGPHAMYLQVNVTNTSGTTMTNLSATFNGFTSTAVANLGTGELALHYIGTLAPNAVAKLYWFVTYTTTIGASTNYSVTLSDNNPGTLSSGPLNLKTRSELSAQAGGDVLNDLLGSGMVLGQIIPLTVTYDFGNSNSGDLGLQPVGNSDFDANCFELTSMSVYSTSGFTSGPVVAGASDLYYPSGVNTSGSSNPVKAVYKFRAKCTGVSTVVKPFSDMLSGGQEKYTSNFGAVSTIITFPVATNPFTFTKSVTPTYLSQGGSVTYTVRVTNSSVFDSLFDVISDTLPGGASFGNVVANSDVNAANSSAVPAFGTTGTAVWRSLPTQSWQVPANGGLVLIYTATLPNVSDFYTNSVTLLAGNVQMGPVWARAIVGTPTAVRVEQFSATAALFASQDDAMFLIMVMVAGVFVALGLRRR